MKINAVAVAAAAVNRASGLVGTSVANAMEVLMAAMNRLLPVLLFTAFSSGSAAAFDPEGATVELSNFRDLGGFSFGVFGMDSSRTARPAEYNQLQSKTAALEASWSGGGFLVALSAGRTSYAGLTLSGIAAGSANFTGLTLRQEIGSVARGTIGAEFSGYRYDWDGETWRELNVSLKWSRKF
ncbi:MAG: hypothetical protein KIS73_12635 [Enhydrobacter sp.]|nr:hypothetical protein [Enhydrobacter sp.]